MSRIYEPTTGTITFDGHSLLDVPAHGIAGAGVARTFQNLALFPTMTVLENVMVGATSTSKASWVTAALRIGAKREDEALKERAFAILSELGLARYALHPATGLPYGTLKRIEIARAMAATPRLLLLDEPASGLTHQEVDELADTVRLLRDTHRLTVLLVEHHMQMVMGISDKVVVLNFGRKIADGTPGRGVERPERDRGLPREPSMSMPDGAPLPAAGTPVLSVTGLHASYGPVAVLHGLDFVVHQGEIVVLLGANGAGKTTTIRALCNMVDTKGSVVFEGPS